jgi:hypothetical protein
MTSEDDEVQMRMICAALEMVYRASSESLIKSYKEVGGGTYSCVVAISRKLQEISLLS